MKNKIQKRYIRKSVFYSIISLAIIVVLLKLFFSHIDLTTIDNNYQYNVITLSATLAGFLFTGISILISVIDKENINRFWKYHYLDALCITSFLGIFIFLITILLSLLFVLFNILNFNEYILFKIQIILIWNGVANFLYCIKELIFVIKQIKKAN